MARRGRPPVRRVPRRRTSWARSSVTNSLTTNVPLRVSLLDPFMTDLAIPNMLPGITVGPIRGQITFVRTGTVTVTNALDATVFWGIQAATEATDADDMDPESHQHTDWMWWERLGLPGTAQATGTTPAFVATGMQRRYVDIRSMRKLDEVEMDLFLVVKAIFSSGNLSFDGGFSTLLRLP